MKDDNINSIVKTIELAWIKRAEGMTQSPSSETYRNHEVEFFVGAMTVLQTVYPDEDPTKVSRAIPITWIINPQSGRLIVDRYRVNRTNRLSMIERANVLLFNSHGSNPPSSEVIEMASNYIMGKDSGQFLSYIESLPEGE